MADKRVVNMADVESKPKVISFSEIRGLRNPFGTQKIARLDEYINRTILIKDFKVDKGERFNFVYILAVDEETNEEITLRTTSRVIEKQLQQIEHVLREGVLVRATIKRIKRYLALT